MKTESYVYLLTNAHSNVLYTGVTSDLIRRLYEKPQGQKASGSGLDTCLFDKCIP